MGLYGRLILVLTAVVTATDLIWFFHRSNLRKLTLLWTLPVRLITILPIALVFLSTHRRHLFSIRPGTRPGP